MLHVPLSPCPSCRRHVALIEHECPFCGRDLPDGALAPPVAGAPRRLRRAAWFMFATTVATGCSAAVDPDRGRTLDGAVDVPASRDTLVQNDSSRQDVPPAQDVVDVAADDATAADVFEEEPNILPAYGVPPFDAGPEDDGTPLPMYGMPPPPVDDGRE